MVVVIDASYDESARRGHAAGVIAGTVFDEKEAGIVTVVVEDVQDYVPGSFWRRELKCVDAVISQLDVGQISMIVIDGYADFGTQEKALGTCVFEKYGIPVVGVAKNRRKCCRTEGTEVLRGGSRKPLYVTARGIGQEAAVRIVRRMYGAHRLPYLIKLADTCARAWDRISAG